MIIIYVFLRLSIFFFHSYSKEDFESANEVSAEIVENQIYSTTKQILIFSLMTLF